MKRKVQTGHSYPLGATVYPDGVNFCVFSKNCTSVELLLFDDADDAQPSKSFKLDGDKNRTFYYWHIFVPGVQEGQLYGYRVSGDYAPEKGLWFDGDKLLLDPYARAIAVGKGYDRKAATRPGDNCGHAMKSVVVAHNDYDWEEDDILRETYANSVIYEMHVGGFTRHPSSGVAPEKRGTYAGVIEKIPYLKSLGVTAVELLPVHQFDEQDAPPGLTNYWGYSPIGFFAPHQGYSSDKSSLGPVYEFRDMVKALHKAGIEVILDVVYNHTAERDHTGPILSFRGLENRAYYIPDPNDRTLYANYSGCGNTLNTNQSIVRRLIIDSLRAWVSEMHVDGFRFDLASVMARDEWGEPLKSPPILWEIESDPILASCKIMAEAWDAAGLYQVGTFIGHRWAEWNGQFRDDVRRFVKGDNDTVEKVMMRVAGSPDLYSPAEREPNRSINFITCHDGFTLNDLVSYNVKHNLANGEDNGDGADVNFSWNCGHEGPTDNPVIEKLRSQQVKNLLTILFVSQGTPMLLMGDEVRRTQQGNNNVYCQDNELSWFNWEALEEQAGLLEFVRKLICFTQKLEIFRQEQFWVEPREGETPHITWHGINLNEPDKGYKSHSLAFELRNPKGTEHLHIILNAYWEPLNFSLPRLPAGECWHCILDTSLRPPEDFHCPDTAPAFCERRYPTAARSAVVLMAKD
ncbi:MAG: glycogen debranching protein GlgX, partial [Anaerolineae bacterium]|nr:glycogen debranching protein GlgX [Anaerolineae bacterium]